MAKEKTMVDSMGQEVPIKYVSKYDKERDRIVRKIHKRFLKARADLEKVMEDSLADMKQLAAARGEAGIPIAGDRGNMQASSFDGLITVAIAVRYEIHLDERVQQARDLMLAYARGLAKQLGGDDSAALLELIDEAFQVSRSGTLSISRVLSLLRRNIRAKEWRLAQKLLAESIETRRGKSYFRVEHRKDRQQKAEPIKLDIADCWPAATK